MDTFDDDVLLVRRSGSLLAAAAVPVAFGAGLWGTGHPSAVAFGVAVAWLGMGGLLYTCARNPGAWEHPAHVHADARGLSIDGQMVFEAGRIQGGWVQPRLHAPPFVHLRARGWRSVAVVVRDVEQGRALLRALEVDPTRVSAHYSALARPLGEPRSFARAATVLALVLALGVVAGQAVPAALALAVIALCVLFVGVAVPTHVTVGADGVHVSWVGTGRFVAWSTVLGIEAYDGGVLLVLDRGEWLTLRVPADHERYQPERDAMVERMRVAWRAHLGLRVDETAARLLRRRGGRTREWVHALRAIVRLPEHGYRVPSFPLERLWRVVEDPHADRISRTGAAVALAPRIDPSGRARLRAAAAGCAEPRLRVALWAAASDTGAHASDEDLAATLDAIEEDREEESPACESASRQC